MYSCIALGLVLLIKIFFILIKKMHPIKAASKFSTVAQWYFMKKLLGDNSYGTCTCS